MSGADVVVEAVPQQHALDLDQPHQHAQLHGDASPRHGAPRRRARSSRRASRRSTSSRSASTPRRNCSPSLRGTRSARSCPRYSARLVSVVVAALRAPVERRGARGARADAPAHRRARSDSSSSRSGRSSLRELAELLRQLRVAADGDVATLQRRLRAHAPAERQQGQRPAGERGIRRRVARA